MEWLAVLVGVVLGMMLVSVWQVLRRPLYGVRRFWRVWNAVGFLASLALTGYAAWMGYGR